MATIAEAIARAFQIQRSGDLLQAEEIYRQILRVDPNHLDALFLLGTVCLKLGKLDDAVVNYERGLRLWPNYPSALNNLGVAFAYQGRLQEAATVYQQVLRLQPNDAAARSNLGNTLRQLGQQEQAAAHLQEALRLAPDHGDAHFNYGNLLLEQRKLNDAIASFRRALQFSAVDRADVHANLAKALHEQGKIDDARTHYTEALRLKPSHPLRVQLATLLPPIYDSIGHLHDCRQQLLQALDELSREGVTIDLERAEPTPLFYLPYQGLQDRAIQEAFAGLHVPPRTPAPPAARGTASRIKIGFLSYFFRNHTVGELMGGLITHLARDVFDVTVLAVGWPRDATAQYIRQHAEHYVDLPATLSAARRCVAEQQLDILFYTDIGMEPRSYGLAFSRLAPVQCTTWGHPETTGIETIDYYVSGELFETDHADRYYTERLVRLKSLPFYCQRLVLPSPPKSRADFDLPQNAHLYGCPQSLFKLHPEFDAFLGAILSADPLGLVLLHLQPERSWDEQLQRRFAATIPDVVDRIRFLPRVSADDFMRLSALANVLLDPIHFNGGYTTLKSLAVGTPIVTLPTSFLRGRMTLGFYQRMHVLDCVAQTPEEYVRLAVRLGTEPDYRAAMREKILAANGVLYENLEVVRELEAWLASLGSG